VIAHDPDDFTEEQGKAAASFISAIDEQPMGRVHLRAVPLIDAPGLLESRQLGTTLVVFLYVDPLLGESEEVETIDGFAAGLQRVTEAPTVHVTGAVPASREETDLAEDRLLWVELATIALVVLILALYFRSPGIPLLGLVTVGIAYLVADHVLGWANERYGIEIPREVDPVLVALLFGILTDYLVFFASDYRRHLQEGMSSCAAVREVTTELLPVISTAALMIAGAALTLLLSGVKFLSAFGPGLAVAVLVGAAVALTFVPAMLAIFGRILLWPNSPDPETAGDHPKERGPRGRAVGFAARHPAIVSILCLLVLLAAASGLRDLEIGNPIIRGLPESTDARQGYDVATETLGPGVLGPTMLVLEEPGIGERAEQLTSLQLALREQDGIAGVVGPAMEHESERSYGVLVAESGDAARYVLVLAADPDGAEGTQILADFEDELPALLEEHDLADAEVGITGDTTIATELNDDTWSAFARVTPAALLVLLVLLWALLRSRSAPLYLVGVSVLVVAAALGLTVYVFQGLLGYGELAFFVPIATAILLLALGADYNVFLISRIWSEAERQDLRPAIRTAGSRAARAIMVAGLILSLSFAAVALIPIESFQELAFAMAVGLLLDTLLARTLLIPALVSLFGRE
ncbi:MAG TPA: MMPL family transporter, partial [Solirubrobacterales bacterium]|nr:MMPL family transporter [Solirubrobacterales bacterium]